MDSVALRLSVFRRLELYRTGRQMAAVSFKEEFMRLARYLGLAL